MAGYARMREAPAILGHLKSLTPTLSLRERGQAFSPLTKLTTFATIQKEGGVP
jgi:hypothetical protein